MASRGMGALSTEAGGGMPRGGGGGSGRGSAVALPMIRCGREPADLKREGGSETMRDPPTIVVGFAAFPAADRAIMGVIANVCRS